MASLRFDTSALTAPVDQDRAHAEGREMFRREDGRAGEAVALGESVFRSVVLVVGAGVLAALFVFVVQLLAGGHSADVTTFVIAGLMILPLAVSSIRGTVRGRRERDEAWYRLTRFAQANGLAYDPVERDPQRPAAVFSAGRSRVAIDMLTGSAPRRFEVGTYRYDTWVARTRMPHTATWVAFELRAGLPPLTIVCTPGTSWPRPWKAPAAQHPLAISDAFDARLTVRAAPGDGEPVRRLLTPALQDALLEVAARCDVEVVEGKVFFVTRTALPSTAPAYWEWIEDLAALVERTLDPSPEAAESDGAPVDESRRARRAALFTASPGGRALAIGCLLPLVAGALAAIASVAIRW